MPEINPNNQAYHDASNGLPPKYPEDSEYMYHYLQWKGVLVTDFNFTVQ